MAAEPLLAVDEALRRVGLSAHADRPFHELSGGQQQRAAVARALAQHARGGVLLLDEAFAAVDPPEAAALVRELRIEGIRTTVPLHLEVLANSAFHEAQVDTTFVERMLAG